MNDSVPQQDDRYAVIEAGFNGNKEVALQGLHHVQENVRVSALRALHRMSALTDDVVNKTLSDESEKVRRTAVELAVSFQDVNIAPLINDPNVFVCEMTAWALGERAQPSDEEINVLINATLTHNEMVVREAAAAALGSIGDPRGLPAILVACSDKPTVRRRAILALAPFEGPEVDAALEKAMEDNDWQVRQNAEILLHPRS